jgi:hypothetical protein
MEHKDLNGCLGCSYKATAGRQLKHLPIASLVASIEGNRVGGRWGRGMETSCC